MRRKSWRGTVLSANYYRKIWYIEESKRKMKEEVEEETCACRACVLPDREVLVVQNYLTEVVERLMDVEAALNGAKTGASIEKGSLIRVGRDSRYQQGIIDVCDEIMRYATGEESLKIAIEEVLKARKQMMEAEQKQKPMDSTYGKDVL